MADSVQRTSTRRTARPARGPMSTVEGAAESDAAGSAAGGGQFLGGALSLGNLIQNTVADAISGISLNTATEDQPMSVASRVSAPRTLDALFAERDAARAAAGKAAVSPAGSEDRLSDGESLHSWCSEDSVSSVQLLDGTDAMVRYLRKGIGALECPVCSQLLNQPVTPIKTHGGCACSFCHDCIGKMLAVSVINGVCRCPKCFLEVPTDVADYTPNTEIMRTIAEFQRQGGEAVEYASMMTELTRSMEKSRSQEEKYPKLSMGEFSLDPKPLATGAYGQVYKGVWESRNLAIALKKIFIASNSLTQQDTLKAFRKECEVLSLLDHPHVLRLYGAIEEGDNICIVTELVPGGSLFDLIHTKPLLKPEAVIVIGQGVCKGMTYLHSMAVIHRDLKPGNLLMSAVQSPSGPELIVKVADFGLARVQDSVKTMTGGIGTSQYTAPEVLRSERYDAKVDVYSFGIVLWEMHSKKLPYSEMTQTQIAVAVATQNHRPSMPPNCPEPFWQLMQLCWQGAPAPRPSFPEILLQLEDMQFVFSLAPSSRAPDSRSPQASINTGGHAASHAGGAGGAFAKTLAAGGSTGRREEGRAGGAGGDCSMDICGTGGEGSCAMGAAGGGAGGAAAKRRTLRVPQEYRSIASAVAACRDNDCIVLAAGHYKESVTLNNLVVSIMGEGSMQGLLIEGVAGAPALTQVDGFVRLSKVMVKSAGSPGIAIHGAMLVAEDCYVSGGQSGIDMADGGDLTLRRSVVCR